MNGEASDKDRGALILTVVIVFLSTAIQLHNNNPDKWPYQDFKYVKAYLYNLDNKLYGKHAIIKDSKLDPTVVGDGVRLDQKQTETLVALTNKDIGGLIQGLSKSYIPHHGFVFYDQEDKPVAYITLCFDCEALRVWPEIPIKQRTTELSDQKIKTLLNILEQYKRLVLDLKLPVFKTPHQYSRYKLK